MAGIYGLGASLFVAERIYVYGFTNNLGPFEEVQPDYHWDRT